MAVFSEFNREIKEINRMSESELRNYAICNVQTVDFFRKKNIQLREEIKELKEEQKLDKVNIECGLGMCECILSVIDMYEDIRKKLNQDKVDLALDTILSIKHYTSLWINSNRE